MDNKLINGAVYSAQKKDDLENIKNNPLNFNWIHIISDSFKSTKGLKLTFVKLFFIFLLAFGIISALSYCATGNEFWTNHEYAQKYFLFNFPLLLIAIIAIFLIWMYLMFSLNLLTINHLRNAPSKSVSSNLKKLYFRPLGKFLFANINIYLILALFIISISFVLNIFGNINVINGENTVSEFIFQIIYMVISIVVSIMSIILIDNDKVSSFQSIKYAWEIFKKRPIALFLIHILWFVIFFISAIPFGIGLLWSIPAFYIYYVKLYQIAVNEKIDQ